eukprot:scaffold192353_cov26-Prasinocladus_malaysianus.AAC.1
MEVVVAAMEAWGEMVQFCAQSQEPYLERLMGSAFLRAVDNKAVIRSAALTALRSAARVFNAETLVATFNKCMNSVKFRPCHYVNKADSWCDGFLRHTYDQRQAHSGEGDGSVHLFPPDTQRLLQAEPQGQAERPRVLHRVSGHFDPGRDAIAGVKHPHPVAEERLRPADGQEHRAAADLSRGAGAHIQKRGWQDRPRLRHCQPGS